MSTGTPGSARCRIRLRRPRSSQQDQDVDVGAGVQFAAAIAADGDQVDFARVHTHVQAPGAAQHDVDHARTIAHEAFHRFVVGKPQLEAGIAIGQGLAKGGDDVSGGLQRGWQRRQEGPRGSFARDRARVQVVDRASGVLTPGAARWRRASGPHGQSGSRGQCAPTAPRASGRA